MNECPIHHTELKVDKINLKPLLRDVLAYLDEANLPELTIGNINFKKQGGVLVVSVVNRFCFQPDGTVCGVDTVNGFGDIGDITKAIVSQEYIIRDSLRKNGLGSSTAEKSSSSEEGPKSSDSIFKEALGAQSSIILQTRDGVRILLVNASSIPGMSFFARIVGVEGMDFKDLPTCKVYFNNFGDVVWTSTNKDEAACVIETVREGISNLNV